MTIETRGRKTFSNADHNGVMLTFLLLKALDIGSLCAKLKQVEKGPSHYPDCIPKMLSLEKMDLWAKNRLWKRYEATLLSLGFVIDSSNKIDFEKLFFENYGYAANELSYDKFPLFKAFYERDKLLTNSGLFEDNQEAYYSEKVPAISVINWFESMDIDLPSGLADRVKKYQLHSPLESASSPASLNKKERSSLLTLLFAMSHKKPYSYDPTDSHNGAINRVESAITEAGLSMSAKTIRKYLREANSEAEKIRDKNQ